MNKNLLLIVLGLAIIIFAVVVETKPKAKTKENKEEKHYEIKTTNPGADYSKQLEMYKVVMKDDEKTAVLIPYKEVFGTEEETETEVAEEIERFACFDVPLSDDLQGHIFELCEEYGVDPAIVFAVIERESSYNENTVGDNGEAFGLMQIQPKWHKERMSRLGVRDLMDPYQNVKVGIDYLAEMYELGECSTRFMLMAYNGGPDYAERKIRDQEISEYARAVIEISRTLERREVTR